MHSLPAGAYLSLNSKDGMVTSLIHHPRAPKYPPNPSSPSQEAPAPGPPASEPSASGLHFLDLQPLPGPADTGPAAPGPPALWWRKRGTG